VLLRIVAKIPDKIDRSALAVQQASQRFHAVSVHKNHNKSLRERLFTMVDRVAPKHNPFQRSALALYLPGLKAEVSRSF
jgi:hypothetical protein